MVGGTSIGALVGALYCDDCDVDKMWERTRVFSTKMAAYKDKLFDLTWPTTSIFTGKCIFVAGQMVLHFSVYDIATVSLF